MVQYRLARLESLLKQEIADIINSEMRDSYLGLVTITRLILSGDLHYVKVYVSIYGEENKQKKLMRKLKSSSRFMRGLIGQRVRMRYTPEISFIQDKSMEEADKIFQIMQDIKEEKEKQSAKRDSLGSKKKK